MRSRQRSTQATLRLRTLPPSLNLKRSGDCTSLLWKTLPAFSARKVRPHSGSKRSALAALAACDPHGILPFAGDDSAFQEYRQALASAVSRARASLERNTFTAEEEEAQLKQASYGWRAYFSFKTRRERASIPV